MNLEFLQNLDVSILYFLNDWGPDWLDNFFLIITNKYTWIPLYLSFIFLLFKSFHWKKALFGLISLILVVALADMISVHLFKNVFQRLRPCHNSNLYLLSLVAESCGGKFGFVSSHAANSFGIATVIAGLFKNQFQVNWIFIWAAVIAYSRVYIGVHYPGDILFGSILGLILGFGVVKAYQLSIRKI